MGNNHKYTKMDRARDELMSHVVRCEVFDAAMDHRREWLDETMDYMAERYPEFSDLQLTQLEMIGRQFIKPPIPHGRGKNAMTVARDTVAEAEGAEVEDEVPTDVEDVENVEDVEEDTELQAA